MPRGEGSCKNLERSFFLHIGTGAYTGVLCAIKTVPSGRKNSYFGQIPLKGLGVLCVLESLDIMLF